MIPGISESLLRAAFISRPTSSQSLTPVGKQPQAQIPYEVVMIWYLSQLHQAIVDAWEQFAETTKQTAQDKNAAHKINEQRRSELEGQRRQIETMERDEEGEYVRCGVHRQAAKFRYLEGQHSTYGHHLYLNSAS